MKSVIHSFLLLFVLAQFCVANHNVLLPPNGKQCFFENLKKNDELAVTFQIGDRNPQSSQQLASDFWVSLTPYIFLSLRFNITNFLLVKVTNENGQVVKKLTDVSHGEVSIKADQNGKYTYCFSNERSSVTTKDVSFNVHGVIYVDVNDKNSDNLEVAIRKLTELTYDVKNEQSYIVVRERTHRNTAESTNSRVKWWSLFQLIVVAANSLFQVYYLKRFFEVKTSV